MCEPVHQSSFWLVSVSSLIIGRRWRDLLGLRGIGDAVPKCAKANRGVVVGCAICELHAQDRDVIDDGRGDGGDEEKDGGCEEQEGADMVKNSSFGHLDFRVLCRSVVFGYEGEWKYGRPRSQ